MENQKEKKKTLRQTGFVLERVSEDVCVYIAMIFYGTTGGGKVGDRKGVLFRCQMYMYIDT